MKLRRRYDEGVVPGASTPYRSELLLKSDPPQQLAKTLETAHAFSYNPEPK
jgi:hypothetical protein